MITVKINYRKNSKPQIVSLDLKGTIDIFYLSEEVSKELTNRYSKYIGGFRNMKDREQYRVGQKVMLINKLKELI